MPRTYKCLIFMEHTERFAKELLKTDYKSIGAALMEALYQDQHVLYHDGEFYDGCEFCDQQREGIDPDL